MCISNEYRSFFAINSFNATQLHPALLRLSAMISQYLTRCFVRLPLFAGQSQKWEHQRQKSVGQKSETPDEFPCFSL